MPKQRAASKDEVIIYHNTRCSKSRGACEIVRKKKIKAKIIEYLFTPPTEKEMKALLKKLEMKAEELVRKKEDLYEKKFSAKKFTGAQWINILVRNPVLIERPIVVKGNKAVIARPPEKVLELL